MDARVLRIAISPQLLLGRTAAAERRLPKRAIWSLKMAWRGP